MLKFLRKSYWAHARTARNWSDSLLKSGPAFRDVVLHDYFGRRAALRPVSGEVSLRASLAVRWLLRAHDATVDDGVSYGKFPGSGSPGWEPSYPETTGYIMTSLLTYAEQAGEPDLVDRVTRMGHWEASVQMPSGAVQGGKVTDPEHQKPATFNTGMVLDGYVSLLERRKDAIIESAAERAVAFLLGDMTKDGLFATNGPVVSDDEIKLYNVLCAWALHRHGRLTGEPDTCAAAIRAAEGALRFQAANGWFSENCLTRPATPLTHTIGYTLQGLLEVAVLAERDDILAAVECGYKPIIEAIEPNGYLVGRFDSGWRPAADWSCLTGSAQLAIVGYRLASIRGDQDYADAADRLLNFLKAVQRVNSGDPDFDGALAGSYPILGDYMTGGYPNWATKYLLDALMLQAERHGIQLGTEEPRQEVAA